MKMVTIEPAPTKPDAITVADYELIKKGGKVGPIPFATALQNVKLSKGGYKIVVEGPPKAQMVAPSLDEMPDADLKRLYLQTLSMTGKKPGKQVSREDMRKTIRLAEDAIEIIE